MENNTFSMVRFNLITSLFAILNQNDENDVYFTLAQFCLEHLNELETMSIRRIEEECFASRSSIKRFFKDIGFESLSAMKVILPDLQAHQRVYQEYANRPDFGSYVASAIQEMMAEVDASVTEQMLDALSEQIYHCAQMVLVCSDCSSSSARSFQQSMVVLGRVVRLVTDSTAALKQLEHLSTKDLLLVVSVSGNYAHAIHSSMSGVKAHRILLTQNHSRVFDEDYDEILYLTRKQEAQDEIAPQRSVYNQYAAIYVLDRLHSHYLRKYPGKACFLTPKSEGSRI